jgi:hypothetical protein
MQQFPPGKSSQSKITPLIPELIIHGNVRSICIQVMPELIQIVHAKADMVHLIQAGTHLSPCPGSKNGFGYIYAVILPVIQKTIKPGTPFQFLRNSRQVNQENKGYVNE